MALGKARNSIVVKGGGNLQLREMNPTPGSFLSVGYLKSTSVVVEHSMVEHVAENGLLINYQSAGDKITVTAQLMQSAIDELNLLNNADGKVYELYYSVLLPNGNTQELVIPLFKLRPGINKTFQSGEQLMEMMGVGLAVKAALTRTPTAYNQAIDTSFVLVSNASPQGAPSDAAGTVFSNAW